MNVFSKVFGTHSQREVKRIMPLVEKTEALRPEMQKLTDEQLRDKTREFKKRLEEGATLDDLCRRRSRPSARRRSVCLEWSTTVCRSSAESSFIRDVFPR